MGRGQKEEWEGTPAVPAPNSVQSGMKMFPISSYFQLQQNNWCIFLPPKFKQPAPSNVLLNGAPVQFSDQIKHLGVLLNASLKDNNDFLRQVKSLCCAPNKLRGNFAQCSTAVKNSLVLQLTASP